MFRNIMIVFGKLVETGIKRFLILMETLLYMVIIIISYISLGNIGTILKIVYI